MTDYAPGTRVRVTYEGEIDQFMTRGRLQYQRVGAHHATSGARYYHAIYPGDTVEILAPPERRFEDGALYLYPELDRVYRYQADGDRFMNLQGRGSYRLRSEFGTLIDTLVKLIPEDSA